MAVQSRNERDAQVRDVALRCLEGSRMRLMMAFRFLDRALWQMPLAAGDVEGLLATDGLELRFDAHGVMKAYRKNPDAVVRAFLHSVLHCIFRHPLRTVRKDPAVWNLACDICVEAVALQLCGLRFETPGDKAIRKVVDRLEDEGCALVPSQVYRRLLMARTNPDAHRWLQPYAEDPETFGAPFARDSHELWDIAAPKVQEDSDEDIQTQPGPHDQGASQGESQAPAADSADGEDSDGGDSGDGGEGGAKDDLSGEGADDGRAGQGGTDGSPQLEMGEETAGAEDGQTREASVPDASVQDREETGAEQAWQDIAQQVQTEMQSFLQAQGTQTGRMDENLTLANRKPVDYEDFLRRFCALNERIKTNDEEFDYVFYTYGLQRYGNMPLIEPLEYQESFGLREFVIAIDTSGSCSGELVRQFLTRTCDILGQAHLSGTRVNIHVVQCDAAVQSDTVITQESDLRDLVGNLTVRGFGGTDFRPVFAYVDELVQRGEFSDLRGLVYFTDGFGVFPKNPPGYDVAFVFVEEEGRQRRVPPWACKAVIGEDDILQIDAQGNALEGNRS